VNPWLSPWQESSDQVFDSGILFLFGKPIPPTLKRRDLLTKAAAQALSASPHFFLPELLEQNPS